MSHHEKLCKMESGERKWRRGKGEGMTSVPSLALLSMVNHIC